MAQKGHRNHSPVPQGINATEWWIAKRRTVLLHETEGEGRQTQVDTNSIAHLCVYSIVMRNEYIVVRMYSQCQSLQGKDGYDNISLRHSLSKKLRRHSHMRLDSLDPQAAKLKDGTQLCACWYDYTECVLWMPSTWESWCERCMKVKRHEGSSVTSMIWSSGKLTLSVEHKLSTKRINIQVEV